MVILCDNLSKGSSYISASLPIPNDTSIPKIYNAGAFFNIPYIVQDFIADLTILWHSIKHMTLQLSVGICNILYLIYPYYDKLQFQ